MPWTDDVELSGDNVLRLRCVGLNLNKMNTILILLCIFFSSLNIFCYKNWYTYLISCMYDMFNNFHYYFFFLQTVFLVTLGSFTFFNVQKTKYLQIFTTIMRWLGKILCYFCLSFSFRIILLDLLILQFIWDFIYANEMTTQNEKNSIKSINKDQLRSMFPGIKCCTLCFGYFIIFSAK